MFNLFFFILLLWWFNHKALKWQPSYHILMNHGEQVLVISIWISFLATAQLTPVQGTFGIGIKRSFQPVDETSPKRKKVETDHEGTINPELQVEKHLLKPSLRFTYSHFYLDWFSSSITAVLRLLRVIALFLWQRTKAILLKK